VLFKATDFINPNPLLSQPFEASTPDERELANVLLDPALATESLVQAGVPLSQIQKLLAQTALNNVLLQQQYLVFDMATHIGVMSSYAGVTSQALQSSLVVVNKLSSDAIASDVVLTAIGAAGNVLSAVPTMYTQIAGAIVGLGVALAKLIMGSPVEIYSSIPAQSYSKVTDTGQFNNKIRAVTIGSDWTAIFLPRYRGQLSMQVRHDEMDRLVFGWGLGDGKVPRITNTGGTAKQDPKAGADGSFDDTGGLGMIPGGERIYSIYQSTLLEQEAVWKYHHTVGDPRCGRAPGSLKVQSLDVGSFYPTSAQAAMTLWDFIFQRGPATYTINPFTLIVAWSSYFNAIWEGAAEYYSNSAYIGSQEGVSGGSYGWGCGPWDASLSDLLSNYVVNGLGQIGPGIGAWAPAEFGDRAYKRLNNDDQIAWAQNNVLNAIIMPALTKLSYAQTWYLQNTSIAAYLPVYGGVAADPSGQMGAFTGNDAGTKSMRKLFVAARKRIVGTSDKYDIRLDDVIDPTFRHEIEDAGGGTQGFGLVAKPPKEQVAAWTPTGGPGIPTGFGDGFEGLSILGTRIPNEVAFVVGGTAATAAMAWVFRDDLRGVYEGARRILRGRR